MSVIFWDLVAFIVALNTLTAIHELNHLWIARFCGVYVERFSIGFGKPLWKHIDRQGTEFVIALIPLGGYVKMLDEHVEILASETRSYAFNNKMISQRAAIIAAGPISNLVFAVLAYWLVFMVGVPSFRPIVGDIEINSIAANAQITPGMELKSIDDIETPDWESVRLQLTSKIGETQITIKVLPPGTNQQQKKVLNLQTWVFKSYKEDPVLALGIHPLDAKIEMVLTKVQNGCAAWKAGLQVGDKIVKVNGHPVTEWNRFTNLIRKNLGKSLTIEIERQGSPLFLNLIPELKSGENKYEGFAGIAPKVTSVPDEYKTVHKYGPLNAIFKATKKTWQIMKATVNVLKKIVTGNIKLSSLSGPIAIAHGAGISVKLGLVYYLMFLALVSINLGIINLLPLPVLDGGHLIFLAIEKFKGNPISEEVQNLSYRIGSILLIIMMGIALFNDFRSII